MENTKKEQLKAFIDVLCENLGIILAMLMTFVILPYMAAVAGSMGM